LKDLLQRHKGLLGGAVITVTVAAVLAFVPWTAPESWRETLTRRLALSLGAPELTATGAHFSLLPSPRVSLTRVSFAQNSGTVRGSAEEAVVDLSLLDLLAGRVKPAALTLRRPDLTIQLPEQSEKGFRSAIELVSQVGGSLLLGQVSAPLPRLDIDGGRIALSRGPHGPAQTFDDARLRLRLPNLRSPLAVTFRARQGQTETRFSFSGATPARTLANSREPITFAYSGQGITLKFDGEGIVSNAPSLNGKLSAGTTAAALGALGFPAVGKPAERVTLNALLDYSNRGANLADLKIAVGEELYDGVGSVRHDGQRWHVSGTLATAKADMSTLLSPITALRKPDGRWNDTALDTDALFASSIDLRLSADQMLVFQRKLEKVALSVITRQSKAEVTLGDASWHKGAVKLRASAAPGSFGVDLKLSASLEKADFGAISGDFLRERRLSGQGNANITLETSGRSIAQFITNAEGRFAAILRNGELHGIDLNRLASRRASRGDLALTEALGGRTSFETANLSAKISNGAAQPVDGHMRAGRLVGTLQGSVDFGQAEHDLSGLVVQTPADAQAAEPASVLEFSIQGPLLEPRITPNVAALLRRS